MKIPTNLRWKPTGKTIGQGGQGHVVEVTDPALSSQVFALKALAKNASQKAYERFAREMSALKNLSHPYIIKVVDYSQPAADFQFYVMEFCSEAESLKKKMDEGRNHASGDALKALSLFEKIVTALAVCEQQAPKIVHRDLSPANVLVLPDETIRLIDFGLCQIENETAITLTDEGVGTPNYMAPECESGSEGRIATPSDLYSAGKILWSAITNQRAFSRETPAFTTKSMQQMFPANPETWHLQHLFEYTIRHDPAKRWQDTTDALFWTKQVRNLILGRYPPVETIGKICVVCGVGELSDFQGSHMVFGNPNPSGIYSRKCDYCGHCFAIDFAGLHARAEERKKFN